MRLPLRNLRCRLISLPCVLRNPGVPIHPPGFPERIFPERKQRRNTGVRISRRKFDGVKPSEITPSKFVLSLNFSPLCASQPRGTYSSPGVSGANFLGEKTAEEHRGENFAKEIRWVKPREITPSKFALSLNFSPLCASQPRGTYSSPGVSGANFPGEKTAEEHRGENFAKEIRWGKAE